MINENDVQLGLEMLIKPVEDNSQPIRAESSLITQYHNHLNVLKKVREREKLSKTSAVFCLRVHHSCVWIDDQVDFPIIKS